MCCARSFLKCRIKISAFMAGALPTIELVQAPRREETGREEFFTLYCTPYGALLPELGHTPRLRLMLPLAVAVLSLVLSPQLRPRLVARANAMLPVMCDAAPPGSDAATLTGSAETA